MIQIEQTVYLEVQLRLEQIALPEVQLRLLNQMLEHLLSKVRKLCNYNYRWDYIKSVLVTGESLRYTVRDMDVIRREARVAADGSRDEIEQMRCACAGFEVIINNMQQMHNTRLQYKVKS